MGHVRVEKCTNIALNCYLREVAVLTALERRPKFISPLNMLAPGKTDQPVDLKMRFLPLFLHEIEESSEEIHI